MQRETFKFPSEAPSKTIRKKQLQQNGKVMNEPMKRGSSVSSAVFNKKKGHPYVGM